MDEKIIAQNEQRKKIIDESRTVAEKEEMTQLIDRIASNSFQG